MRSRLYRRTGSLLALLAMLLITFAPAVSQVIAAHAQAGEFTAELCSAHASAAEAPASHHAPDTLAHLDDAACGYCHFFAHAPAISGARSTTALEIPARRFVAVAPVRGERPASAFATAQPRAPPVLI
ncbi:MFS transporter [Caballeronia peredens]|nr:MFS transporter [Caballeronia peredens]